jgi:hypothetical protein
VFSIPSTVFVTECIGHVSAVAVMKKKEQIYWYKEEFYRPLLIFISLQDLFTLYFFLVAVFSLIVLFN